MKIAAINTNLNINKAYKKNNTSFEGGFVSNAINSGYDKFTDKIAIGIGKIIDTKPLQNFSQKFSGTNIATHIFSATGILLSSFLALSIARNKKIEEERKKPLILNTGISCAIATTGGYTIDKLLDKPLDKFCKNFKQANISNPKLHKYMDGIKIAKSALIFGMLYRFVVPVISMFLAEKVTENKKSV